MPRCSTRAAAFGAVGHASSRSGGPSVATLCAISNGVPPSRGRLPLSASKLIAASAYTSAGGPAPRPSSCSGAMYAAVPSTVPLRVILVVAVGRGGDAQVGELRDAVLADQHVAGLHVAVHNTLRMRMVERVAEVAHHGRDLLGPQRPAAEHPRQRLALHVLHDDQHALVVGGRVEHRDEVRVVQRRSELCLASEALLDVDRAVGMQALDGNLPSESLVLTEEDRRHAARAEVPQYPVAAVEK